VFYLVLDVVTQGDGCLTAASCMFLLMLPCPATPCCRMSLDTLLPVSPLSPPHDSMRIARETNATIRTL